MITLGVSSMGTGDRNGVELRHILGGVAHNISDNAHRRLRGEDESIPNHELLQDIILSLRLFFEEVPEQFPQAFLGSHLAPLRPPHSRPGKAKLRHSWSLIRTLCRGECCQRESSYPLEGEWGTVPTESIATPAMPTSPFTRGWSES